MLLFAAVFLSFIIRLAYSEGLKVKKETKTVLELLALCKRAVEKEAYYRQTATKSRTCSQLLDDR